MQQWNRTEHLCTKTRARTPLPPHSPCAQDITSELRAKRQRTLLSSTQSASVRKGMIRYVLLVSEVHARASGMTHFVHLESRAVGQGKKEHC